MAYVHRGGVLGFRHRDRWRTRLDLRVEGSEARGFAQHDRPIVA
ncbi:MAG TPA: hypothetical protein VKA47_10060 [Solirubrobacterales bacterium]|nr:hypothetical protein [Solirubrobacterales bacterium]